MSPAVDGLLILLGAFSPEGLAVLIVALKRSVYMCTLPLQQTLTVEVRATVQRKKKDLIKERSEGEREEAMSAAPGRVQLSQIRCAAVLFSESAGFNLLRSSLSSSAAKRVTS